jgi:phage FluMu protein gp41
LPFFDGLHGDVPIIEGGAANTGAIAACPDIIGVVLRRQTAAVGVIVLLAACGSNIRSKEKVQAAILERLQSRSGLDLKSLDVTTTSVSFDKNLAYARVAFHPKGDTNVSSGMLMNYTLENRDGKWVVIQVGDSQGHATSGGVGSKAEQLPPGHPPIDSADPHSMSAPQTPTSEQPQ